MLVVACWAVVEVLFSIHLCEYVIKHSTNLDIIFYQQLHRVAATFNLKLCSTTAHTDSMPVGIWARARQASVTPPTCANQSCAPCLADEECSREQSSELRFESSAFLRY